jgi:predicted CXXCH cytochrome family protein
MLLATPAGAQEFAAPESCRACHESEYQAWQQSDHRHAMADADATSVKGDFAEALFEEAGRRVRFLTKDNRYFVEARGADGKIATNEVRYTFGHEPLQQYLLALPGGRLQAFDIAWDTEQGRWFSLQPGDRPNPPPGDRLHWAGGFYNWNSTCGFCHSTGLKKGFDLQANRFETTWADLTVGCQACHGPAQDHVTWAERGADKNKPNGLPVDFTADGNATELPVCATCHARRRELSSDYRPGAPFYDHFLPAPLRQDLYFADGQILDEVYVWGSFQQSRMFASGVTCSNCHEPHSGELRGQGNEVCTQCHNPTPPGTFASIRPLAYDAPAHHFHQAGGPGSQCVDCHMPARTYMGVDPRRDHSFRVPRPDLEHALETPSACVACHDSRDGQWAAARIAEWYGPARRQEPHFGTALAAGRRGEPGAAAKLAALARDPAVPMIARATALSMLGGYRDRNSIEAVVAGLESDQPLMRIQALRAAAGLPANARVPLIGPRLSDPVRAVRIEAARAIADIAARQLPPALGKPFLAAANDYLKAESSAAERPEAHLNIGVFFQTIGRPKNATIAYNQAIRLDPNFVPGYLNLAEMKRAAGDQAAEAALLAEALKVAPEDASAHFAMGLFEIRRRDGAAGLAAIARAAALGPDSPRFAHAHALALRSQGRHTEAIAELDRLLAAQPWHRPGLVAMAEILAETEDLPGAGRYANKLLALNPSDPAALRIIRTITKLK